MTELPGPIAEYASRAADFYQPLADSHEPDTAARAGWSSTATQAARFDEIERLAEFVAPDRVLDVGCCTGAFLERLVESTAFSTYTGVDVVTSNIEAAEQRWADEPRARFLAGTAWDAPGPFEVVIGSGIFALPDPHWTRLVTLTLDHLASIARRYVIVNFPLRTETLVASDTSWRSTGAEIDHMLDRGGFDHSITNSGRDLTVRLEGRAL